MSLQRRGSGPARSRSNTALQFTSIQPATTSHSTSGLRSGTNSPRRVTSRPSSRAPSPGPQSSSNYGLSASLPTSPPPAFSSIDTSTSSMARHSQPPSPTRSISPITPRNISPTHSRNHSHSQALTSSSPQSHSPPRERSRSSNSIQYVPPSVQSPPIHPSMQHPQQIQPPQQPTFSSPPPQMFAGPGPYFAYPFFANLASTAAPAPQAPNGLEQDAGPIGGLRPSYSSPHLPYMYNLQRQAQAQAQAQQQNQPTQQGMPPPYPYPYAFPINPQSPPTQPTTAAPAPVPIPAPASSSQSNISTVSTPNPIQAPSSSPPNQSRRRSVQTSRLNGRDHAVDDRDRDRYYTSFDDEDEEEYNSENERGGEALVFGGSSRNGERSYLRRRRGSWADTNLSSPRSNGGGDTTDFTEEDVSEVLSRRLLKKRRSGLVRSETETETDAPLVCPFLFFQLGSCNTKRIFGRFYSVSTLVGGLLDSQLVLSSFFVVPHTAPCSCSNVSSNYSRFPTIIDRPR